MSSCDYSLRGENNLCAEPGSQNGLERYYLLCCITIYTASRSTQCSSTVLLMFIPLIILGTEHFLANALSLPPLPSPSPHSHLLDLRWRREQTICRGRTISWPSHSWVHSGAKTPTHRSLPHIVMFSTLFRSSLSSQSCTTLFIEFAQALLCVDPLFSPSTREPGDEAKEVPPTDENYTPLILHFVESLKRD